jgi:hypothetical protein
MRLQFGIPVVSIAVVSIAVVSIAVPVDSIAIVSIAAVSIAEPHRVMRLQCWVGFKQKFPFRIYEKILLKVISFLQKKLTIIFCFHENIPFRMRIRIQEPTKCVYRSETLVDDTSKSFEKISFLAEGFEKTKIFAKTFAETKILTKTKIFAKSFAKAKIFAKEN